MLCSVQWLSFLFLLHHFQGWVQTVVAVTGGHRRKGGIVVHKLLDLATFQGAPPLPSALWGVSCLADFFFKKRSM